MSMMPMNSAVKSVSAENWKNQDICSENVEPYVPLLTRGALCAETANVLNAFRKVLARTN